MFRTYQGWLALSETAPNEGTLQVFPNVMLSNAYTIIRPFFTPKEGRSAESFNPDDWKYGACLFRGIASRRLRAMLTSETIQTFRTPSSTASTRSERHLLGPARTPRHIRISGSMIRWSQCRRYTQETWSSGTAYVPLRWS